MGNIMMEILWTVFIKMKSHKQKQIVSNAFQKYIPYTSTLFKWFELNLRERMLKKARAHKVTYGLYQASCHLLKSQSLFRDPSDLHILQLFAWSIYTLAGDVILIILNLYKLGQIHNININIYVYSFFVLHSILCFVPSHIEIDSSNSSGERRREQNQIENKMS